MGLVVKHVADRNQCEELWRRLRERGTDPALETRLSSLSTYEEWKSHLERGVASFWTVQGERLAVLAAYEDGEPVGLVRVLQVPIFPWDRNDWGGDGSRGEIQDLLLSERNEDVAAELVKNAVRLLKEKGLERVGVSCWRPDQSSIVQELGFKPSRRNILLGWRTDHDLHVEPKLTCQLRYVKPGEEKLVHEVFTSTWGFKVNFLPQEDIQQALVAIHDGRPLGTVLINKYSGSIDLGVQVVSAERRNHIGSLLVREALRYYKSKAFEHMYLIRNIPVGGLRQEDEVALQFYSSTGAFPLREYVGFRSR